MGGPDLTLSCGVLKGKSDCDVDEKGGFGTGDQGFWSFHGVGVPAWFVIVMSSFCMLSESSKSFNIR